jgi:ATP adenylyltransferase
MAKRAYMAQQVFAGVKDISGPLQYQVLKWAKGRCELRGISAKVKVLQVDHIKPRSKAGPTALENLRALCYTCNAQKQHKDDTLTLESGKKDVYDARDKDCVCFATCRKKQEWRDQEFACNGI